MNDLPSAPSENPRLPAADREGGIDIQGGDVRAGRDIIGGDVVTVQRTGFSASDVQKIVLTTGVLVFATAACFFLLGLVVSAAALNALNRPLPGGSTIAEAQAFQRKLDAIERLPPGTEFQLTISESEISSYFRFIVGPQVGVSEGKVRFLNANGAGDELGQLVLGGNLDQLGGTPFAATFRVRQGAEPLQLEAAWVKLLPTQDTTFGWIPVTPVVQPLARQLNDLLLGRIQFTRIRTVTTAGVQGREGVWGVLGRTE